MPEHATHLVEPLHGLDEGPTLLLVDERCWQERIVDDLANGGRAEQEDLAHRDIAFENGLALEPGFELLA